MPRFRNGTSVSDETIKEYIQIHRNEGPRSKAVQKELGIAAYRILPLAREVFKDELVVGDTYLDEVGGVWLSAEKLKSDYNLSKTGLCQLKRHLKAKGLVIGELSKRTWNRPLVGELFYRQEDVERYALKIRKRVQIARKRASLNNEELREKPKDLTEREYEFLLVLFRIAILEGKWPSVYQMTKRFDLGSKDTIRKRIKSLAEKKYIQYRKKDGRENGSYEFRLLRGPRILMNVLVESLLIQPFPQEEADEMAA